MSLNGRRRARRRFAAFCGAIAVVLLVGGFVLARRSGSHDVGVICIGYGLGVGVASAFLAMGFDPRRKR